MLVFLAEILYLCSLCQIALIGLNRAGVESKFYSEGALGELNPTLKTVLDILKGISSGRGR